MPSVAIINPRNWIVCFSNSHFVTMCVEFMLPEGGQGFLHVHTVQFERCREDKDVIEMDNKKVIQKFPKDVAHKVLEGGWLQDI